MPSLMPAEPLVISAREDHSATIVFLHGLGDSGLGWKPLADLFSANNALRHIKWILPHAPTIRITASKSAMPAWYDIPTFDMNSTNVDEEGIFRAMQSITSIVDAEIASGTPPERIILGGFSQGAALAMSTALTIKHQLAGLIVLSGRLPMRSIIKSTVSPTVKDLAIFYAHGLADTTVRTKSVESSVEFICDELGVQRLDGKRSQEGTVGLTFKSYLGLPHTTNEEELSDLRAWVKRVIP